MKNVMRLLVGLMVLVGAYDLYAIEQFSRVKVWGREVLTKDDLNAEFDGIINGINTKFLNNTTNFTIIAGDSMVVLGRGVMDTLRVQTIFYLEGDIVPNVDGSYNIGTSAARIDTFWVQDINAYKTETDTLTATLTTTDSINVGSGDFVVAPTQNTTRISNGNSLIVGHNALVSPNGITPTLQVLGTSEPDASMVLGRWSADNQPAYLLFLKSRNATIGSSTIIQDGDNLGYMRWIVDDGTDFVSSAAFIQANIDGTPGANDTPGRLSFGTTADGASAPSEYVRIDNAGNVTIDVDGTMNAGDHDLEIHNGASFSEIDAGETTFTNTSDQTLKENFVTITADDIRDAFMSLNVQRYNFKPSSFLNIAIIDSAFADTTKAKNFGMQKSDIDFVRQRAVAVQQREHAKANAMARKKRVSVMAQDFYPIARALRPSEADSASISGDDQIAALILMVQSLQSQVDSLKTLHK